MGVHANIDYDKFPRQSDWIGKRCEVCFNYDADRRLDAECVRDDREAPHLTIFKLADGRYVTATECQYTMPK